MVLELGVLTLKKKTFPDDGCGRHLNVWFY